MSAVTNSLPIVFCILSLGFIFFVLVLASAIRIVPENTRLSVYRFGRYIGDKGPGLVLLMPFGIDFAERFDVADQVQRAQAQQQMWGVIGETRTPVQADGQVDISGLVWSAVSHEPVPAGAKVRVVKVILEVEQLAS